MPYAKVTKQAVENEALRIGPRISIITYSTTDGDLT
jgi:hypothetical protein